MTKTQDANMERRTLLATLAWSAGLGLAGCATTHEHDEGGEDGEGGEVNPAEDLMQEHGVLERILLVYDEAARRLERAEKIDLGLVSTAAGLVRRFVEDYHEHNEERFVFPRLEKSGTEVELVGVLRQQHRRGRELTDEITRFSKTNGDPAALIASMRAFERMYRPHAAREDTILFPAFRKSMGREAYRELGEQFEESEHEHFGADGFEDAVSSVAALERALGIHDLAQFGRA